MVTFPLRQVNNITTVIGPYQNQSSSFRSLTCCFDSTFFFFKKATNQYQNSDYYSVPAQGADGANNNSGAGDGGVIYSNNFSRGDGAVGSSSGGDGGNNV